MIPPHSAPRLTGLATAFALAALVAPAASGAQDSTRTDRVRVAPGAVVRIRARDVPLPDGPATVVERRGDTLFVRPGDAIVTAVPLDRVTKLTVADGRRSRSDGAWRGARVGALAVGIPFAVLTGVAAISDARHRGECSDFCVPSSLVAGVSGVALTGVATLAGAALGAIAPGERWTRVAPASVRVGVVPTRGGAMVALGVRF